MPSIRFIGDSRVPQRFPGWLALSLPVAALYAVVAFWKPFGPQVHRAIGDFALLGTSLLSASLGVYNAFVLPRAARVFWAFASAAFLSWVVGQAIMTAAEVFQQGSQLYQHWLADWFYSLFWPLLYGAIFWRGHQRRARPAYQLDIYEAALNAIFLAVILFFFYALYLPDYSQGPYHVKLGLDVVSNLMKVGCFGAFFALWRRTREREWSVTYFWLGMATLVYFLGSGAGSWAMLKQVYTTGGLYDVGWLIPFCLYSYAGVRSRQQFQSSRTTPEESSRTVAHVFVSKLNSWLAILTVAFIPIVAISQEVTPGYRKIPNTLVLVTILFLSLAAILRERLGHREKTQLLRQAVQSLEQQKVIQSQLVQAAKLAALGELAAGVAHELNQPLTVIRGRAELGETGRVESDVRNYRMIRESTERMVRIVEHLRNFSRKGSDGFEPVNVSQLVQNSLLFFREQLQNWNIQLRVQVAENLPSVQGNMQQLEQVLLNLYANARDAMEPKGGGVLTVQARALLDQRRVLVSVSDTGTGIVPEATARIFDPFFTTKGAGRGTGLGLSISQRIVQNHGGQLEVSSQPDRGSTFTFSLRVCP